MSGNGWTPRPAQPYQPGNQEARTHGAYASDLGDAAGERAEGLRSSMPWLGVEAFAGSVHDLAVAEVIVDRLVAYLAEHGLLDDDGNPRPAATMLDRWMGRAQRVRSEMGLTPAAWAKLLASLTASGDGETNQLEALRKVGREIREAAERKALEAGS